MADKLIEALKECELFLRVIGMDSEPAAKVAEIAREALAAHRSQQESASPDAKVAEPYAYAIHDVHGNLVDIKLWDAEEAPFDDGGFGEYWGGNTKLYTSTAASESEALLREARSDLADLLAKIRRDAPSLSGKLMGQCESTIRRIDAALSAAMREGASR